MQQRLILMRHAKSDHDDPSLADHDRVLAKRGRRDSPVMANFLADQDLVPARILSSSSTRTRETVTKMLEVWSQTPEVCYHENLYLASAETLLWTARTEHDDASSVLVLAHNPGIAMLASSLAGTVLAMPTAAVAVFRLQSESDTCPLSELDQRSAIELEHYVTPKSLGGDTE